MTILSFPLNHTVATQMNESQLRIHLLSCSRRQTYSETLLFPPNCKTHRLTFPCPWLPATGTFHYPRAIIGLCIIQRMRTDITMCCRQQTTRSRRSSIVLENVQFNYGQIDAHRRVHWYLSTWAVLPRWSQSTVFQRWADSTAKEESRQVYPACLEQTLRMDERAVQRRAFILSWEKQAYCQLGIN